MPHTLNKTFSVKSKHRLSTVQAKAVNPYEQHLLYSLNRVLIRLFLLLNCLSMMSPSLSADDTPITGFAIVELFTSEGCSSCPPADRLLFELREAAQKSGKSVYVLSYHVEYWDNLGWDDPFGLPLSTRRQYYYGNVFDSSRVYTPQMVVNGAVEFVGSNRQRAIAEIDRALQMPVVVQVKSQAKLFDGKISVTTTASQAPADCVLVTAIVQGEATQFVASGENSNRRLTHVNIVRDLNSAPIVSGGNQTSILLLPVGIQPDNCQVVTFLQHKSGAIRGADICTIQTQEPVR